MAATFVATDINYFGFNFRTAGMSDAHAQYEYIQLQQEQKINWTRTFTIEQQLRYGITPTGEPLDVAMLKEIQMHQNFQVISKSNVTRRREQPATKVYLTRLDLTNSDGCGCLRGWRESLL